MYSVQCLVVRRKSYNALFRSASCLLPVKEESNITTIFANKPVCWRVDYLRSNSVFCPFWPIDSYVGIDIPLLDLIASAVHAFFILDHISTSFHILIDQLAGLLILPSLGIPIPLFTEDVFMMEVFHDIQIQSLQYPAGHIE